MTDCTSCGTWNPEDKDVCWRCQTVLPRPVEKKPKRAHYVSRHALLGLDRRRPDLFPSSPLWSVRPTNSNRIVTSHQRTPDTDIFTLLQELSETPGVSGQEDRIRAAVSNHLVPLVDVLRVDALGNLIGFKQGAGPSIGRVMLAAHMDEIGLIVTKLDGGFLRFAPVGGVDSGALPAQEVTVHGRSDLPGLIASRPPHVLSREEREKPFTQEQLFIDVGLSARRAGRVRFRGRFRLDSPHC